MNTTDIGWLLKLYYNQIYHRQLEVNIKTKIMLHMILKVIELTNEVRGIKNIDIE